MLASGSLASASRAALVMAMMLRSASARRFRADAFACAVVFAIAQWTGIACGLSASFARKCCARGRTARATKLARPAIRAAIRHACPIPEADCRDRERSRERATDTALGDQVASRVRPDPG